jgi:hypothetical protein
MKTPVMKPNTYTSNSLPAYRDWWRRRPCSGQGSGPMFSCARLPKGLHFEACDAADGDGDGDTGGHVSGHGALLPQFYYSRL